MTGFPDYCAVMKFCYDGLCVPYFSCSGIAVEEYIHRDDVDDIYLFTNEQWSPTSTIRVFDRHVLTIRTSDEYLVNLNVSRTVVI